MTQLRLNLLSDLELVNNGISEMKSMISGYTKIRYNDLLDMIIEDEEVYKSLDSFSVLNHNVILMSSLFNQESVFHRFLDFQLLTEIHKTLVENFSFLTNIDGHFVFLKDKIPRCLSSGLRKLVTTNVYLARDSSGLIKIGKSQNIQSRIKTLKTGNTSIELIKTYPVLINDKVESSIHNQFDKYRISGEWFSVNVDDVDDYIKSYFCLNTGHNIINGRI